MHHPTNRLMGMLPRRGRRRIFAIGEIVSLPTGDVLCESGVRPPYVYFPLEGLLSVRIAGTSRERFEIGLIGREGALGVAATLALAASPADAIVQAAGLALRLSAVTFRLECETSSVLQRLMNRYLFVLMAQMAQSTACARFHALDARLARRLLMVCDRTESCRFRLTHLTLAQMLGVRRVGVTNAAGLFQEQGLVTYSRGAIRILDRPGLEALSCICYREERAIYERLLGSSRKPRQPRA